MKKIIYVMDPHCGWCYGNSKNIASLTKIFKEKFVFEVVVGGMWLGNNAPTGGIQLSNFISNGAQRLEEVTGMPIGASFLELTENNNYTFSSLEPSAAIVLVKKLAPQKAILFAKKIQEAIFVYGKRLDEVNSYISTLNELEIDQNDFTNNWLTENNIAATKKEFLRAGKMANGFPTTLFEENGQVQTITSGYFRLKEMEKYLHSL